MHQFEVGLCQHLSLAVPHAHLGGTEWLPHGTIHRQGKGTVKHYQHPFWASMTHKAVQPHLNSSRCKCTAQLSTITAGVEACMQTRILACACMPNHCATGSLQPWLCGHGHPPGILICVSKCKGSCCMPSHSWQLRTSTVVPVAIGGQHRHVH
jgi:hypothetical protein